MMWQIATILIISIACRQQYKTMNKNNIINLGSLREVYLESNRRGEVVEERRSVSERWCTALFCGNGALTAVSKIQNSLKCVRK